MIRVLCVLLLLLLAPSSVRAQIIYGIDFQDALPFTDSTATNITDNTNFPPGTCATGVVWNYTRVAPGASNGGYNDRGYVSQRLCDYDTTGVGDSGETWSAGFQATTPNNVWPSGAFFGRLRIYFESAVLLDSMSPDGDAIRTMKFWMWHTDVYDGDQRVIGFIERGDMCGTSAVTTVCFALGRNINTGAGLNPSNGTDVARASCTVGEWCNLQWSWRHGVQGVSHLKLWVNNNVEASPTAQDTQLTAVPTLPGGTSEWVRDENGYNISMLLGHVANDGTAFENEFVIRYMDFEIDDAFDATWSAQAGGETTYYVATTGNNGNAGTIGSPWLTVPFALGQLACGNTLYLRTGSYAGFTQAHFVTTCSSWGSPITISGYPGETVTLTGNGGADAITFNDDTRHYIIMKDFRINGAQISVNDANSDHLRFQNLELSNADHNCLIAGGSSHEFIDLNVHGCGQATIASPSTNCDNGIYLYGDNFIVRGGSYWNNESFGIRLYDSGAASGDNGVIERVQVYQNGLGIGIDGQSASLCGGGGIVVAELNHIIQNSLIYRNYAGILVYASGVTTDGTKLYHNTVTANVNLGVELYATSTNTVLTNNIIFNNGTNYQNNGTGTVVTSSLLTDPSFTSPGSDDFTLQAGSAAINAGTVLGLGEDFVGAVRPSGAGPDIGAYEFQEGEPPPADPGSARLRFTS